MMVFKYKIYPVKEREEYGKSTSAEMMPLLRSNPKQATSMKQKDPEAGRVPKIRAFETIWRV